MKYKINLSYIEDSEKMNNLRMKYINRMANLGGHPSQTEQSRQIVAQGQVN